MAGSNSVRLSNAKDVSALKAVSQNLMHENLTITDGVYGILSDSDVRKRIAELGNRINLQGQEELKVLISNLLSLLDVDSNLVEKISKV